MHSSLAAPNQPDFASRFANFAASALVVALACLAYVGSPHHQEQLTRLYGFGSLSYKGAEFLGAGASLYVALLAVYFLYARDPKASKSLRFLRVVAAFLRAPARTWRQGLAPEDRLAVLTTLLKAFFAPLMAMSLMMFCVGALQHGSAIVASGAFSDGFRALFDRHGFWFVIQAMLFIDVLVFTVGYLVESPTVRNEIRSVDPTLLGWTAALLCYPPFNTFTSWVLGQPVSDFPRFDDPTAHLALNILLLALMAVYTSASVALGFKASNLTHRGIIARGPYAFVRHPAYVCKNMAWWIGSIPLVSEAFGQSAMLGMQTLASVAGWTMLYALRALIEEDHLRRVDGEYAAYAAKVRYRFIPGVY